MKANLWYPYILGYVAFHTYLTYQVIPLKRTDTLSPPVVTNF